MNSLTTAIKQKPFCIAIWVALHAILFVLGVLSPWNVETDLYSVLPDSSEFKNVSEAEKALSARSMRNISVLLGHENFDVAKNAAETIEQTFSKDAGFEETRLHVDANSMKEMRGFLFEKRYVLQSPSVREALKNGDLSSLQDAAAQKIYGAFSMADLGNLEWDPLLLGEQNFDYFTLESPLMSGKFSLRDGVLAAADSNVTYVMWSAVISNSTSAMANDGHVLGRLYETLDSLRMVEPGLKIAKSGVPFHSYESSRNAQSEIAWISGISIVLILILLLTVYRSTLPILCTVGSIGIAAAAALATTWLLFGSIHIFTFVFGTSVIGVSIDYAIHFFTDWKKGSSGFEVRRHILKGLLLGFMTTELSYIALTFADFPLLKQMSVFSIAGLASSFATILLLFPCLPQNKKAGVLPTIIPQKFISLYLGAPRKWVANVVKVALLLALVPGLYLLNVQTDMRTMYSMSDELKTSEVLSAKLNNLGISANYFIVEGASPEEVLRTEEDLVKRLDVAKQDSLIKNFLATSSLIPSQKIQNETIENLRNIVLSPKDSNSTNESLHQYLEGVGITNDSAFVNSLKVTPEYLTVESKVPQSFKSLLNMLWIGEVNGKYYSAVLPLHVSKDFDISKLADGNPKVYAVNKMGNINDTLTNLSRVALMLVAIAYVIVFVILVLVYKFRTAVRIIRAPVIACLFLASVFGYAGITFNFFAIVGIILTLGIGIDYALFFNEGGRKNLTTALAVMLSATTTVISFGSLSFSSFTPVATFGLATLLGILCCFTLSPLSARSVKKEDN
ncbi:MAG: MMPL family transporter [Fibrobacter sp.]|nr:MMPL family transporter [Fibrobacter sp.]